jgi:hypothetical protein
MTRVHAGLTEITTPEVASQPAIVESTLVLPVTDRYLFGQVNSKPVLAVVPQRPNVAVCLEVNTNPVVDVPEMRGRAQRGPNASTWLRGSSKPMTPVATLPGGQRSW